jgi:hypothetical protein
MSGRDERLTNQPFLTGDSVVRFTVTLQAAISAFANTLGYYKVTTDGTITGVDILFADTRNPGATTVSLATPGSGEQIGFFLVQNGFGQFGALPYNLSFVAQDSSAAQYDAGPVFLMCATLGVLTPRSSTPSRTSTRTTRSRSCPAWRRAAATFRSASRICP